jgi:RNA polymerase sigma-70 factor, ECF subfamily
VTKPEPIENDSGADAATTTDAEVEALLVRAGRGDTAARDELLARHRSRLWRMIAVRLDRRMAARVDASDIVQEALTEAAGRLSDYVTDRPLPFYPWLRHIAWQHLIKCQKRHLGTQRRSVAREQRAVLDFTEQSAAQLADRLVADDTSPSGRAIRGEERERVRAALALLPPRDHEVLVLRHLELLSTGEIAAVLGLSTGAVMTRHTRALERLRALLELGREEESP